MDTSGGGIFQRIYGRGSTVEGRTHPWADAIVHRRTESVSGVQYHRKRYCWTPNQGRDEGGMKEG